MGGDSSTTDTTISKDPPPSSSSSYAALLSAANCFCALFADKSPPDKIRACFSSSSSPSSSQATIYEHGLPHLAPFLGREFRGREGIDEYFGLLASLLSYEEMRFDDEGWIVDVERRKVGARGSARFTWLSTGKSWEEVFAYALKFCEEEEEGEKKKGEGEGAQKKLTWKVLRYEIWADTGAAFLASQGG